MATDGTEQKRDAIPANPADLFSPKQGLQRVLQELMISDTALTTSPPPVKASETSPFDREFNKFDREFNKFDREFNKFDREFNKFDRE
jgi:hypothetical protein